MLSMFISPLSGGCYEPLSRMNCRKQCSHKLALVKAKEKTFDLMFLTAEDIYGSEMIGSICDAALLQMSWGNEM